MKNYLLIVLAGAILLPTAAYSAVKVVEVMSKEDISVVQDDYFKMNGKYLQVLASSTLPSDEKGSVSEKLGKDLPPGAVVDVYESPKGHGYQIKYEENGTFYSVGYGPEAKARTYSHSLTPTASSTTPGSSQTASTTVR